MKNPSMISYSRNKSLHSSLSSLSRFGIIKEEKIGTGSEGFEPYLTQFSDPPKTLDGMGFELATGGQGYSIFLQMGL